MEIKLNHLTKKYKTCVAVNNVSMNIKSPIIYGLIGKNGAGKTTLLKMIAGLTTASSGSVNYIESSKIGVLIEEPGLYGHLKVRDNLIIKMKFMGISDNSNADYLLDKIGLASVANVKTSSLSLGMKQRLGIAMALVGDPQILLLDEPTNGLDPEGVILVRNLLIDLRKKGKIVVVSSHLLEELSKIADRYGILDNGVLVREFNASEIEYEDGEAFLVIVDNLELSSAILSESGIKFSLAGSNILINESEKKAGFAISKLFESGVRVHEFKRQSNALERILLERRY